MKDKYGNPIAGERLYWKLEYIISTMKTRKMDIYCMCETWAEENWTKVIDGYTIFHHNNNVKTSRQGVAIILSPRFTKAWKDAGGLPPILGPKEGELSGRIIAVTVKFPKFDENNRVIKGAFEEIVIASVYHPYDDKGEQVNNFNDLLNDVLDNLPENCKLIRLVVIGHGLKQKNKNWNP
jgi:exonuclease III